jgi:Fe-S-cluster-containing dehydrogenase component
MSLTRRGFLGAAGLSALAAAGRPVLDVIGEAASSGQGAAPAAMRLAMVIDPRKCLDAGECTKCSDACHRAHNVPAIAGRAHEVKWIWKERFENAFPSIESSYAPDALRGRPVMVLCNHCDNPPCVRVCPTRATWRRDDGIVMMDEHRCIGCRYCMAACPYGSRSFNWSDPRPAIASVTPDYPTRTKGVVEKCTFCEERLARGERPACVDACPARAIVFGRLDDPQSEVRALLRTRFAVQRRAELGTRPSVYYLV